MPDWPPKPNAQTWKPEPESLTMNPAFTIAALPKIIFGSGMLKELPGEIKHFGKRALIVTGAGSFIASAAWAMLRQRFADEGISFELLPVPGEPSPEGIDAAVTLHKASNFDVVVGIGGGSALDAAKAIAG
ncbi:MAG: iron-containing alcohol dehydrogenase, partial [Rhodospirillales bacterium]|nr:iron-containing alcohol dehydrogenase [Rhodospirillales bacterium]